ncbi:hypothetical protein [Kocuria palustris]|uniref:hypothetical protein n=1 Tax=Kocuria palustris TaxID=71999 RepID=UPI002301338A|nr:hypothetical protein [Kocuria palustris]
MMGLFSRKQTPESEPRTADADVQQTQPRGAETAAAGQQLPESGPLRSLVDGLLVDGAERAKLTLVQRGSTMSYQSERAAADGSPETDSGVVDQASPLFDDVAALYTESMNSSTGAWQTVVITAAAPEADGRSVTVDYDFPAAEHRTEQYRVASGSAQADPAAQGPLGDSSQGGARTGAIAAGVGAGAGAGAGAAAAAGGRDQSAPLGQDQAGTAEPAAEQRDLGAESREDRRRDSEALSREPQAVQDTEARTPEARTQEARLAEARTADARGTEAAASETSGAEARPVEAEQRSAGAGVAGAAAGAGAAGVVAGSEQRRVPEGQLTDNGTVDNLAPRQQGQEPIEVDHEVQESVARTAGHQSAAGSGTSEQHAGTSAASQAQGEQIPAHVDHDEWRDDSGARRSPAAAPTGAAAAHSVSSRDGSGAPTVASGADVAPSYRAAEQAAGGEDLAQGNKVLSQKDIARRVAGAQKRLFGADGSARDVSTVLIRVRTLGTYYDALTHVRQGGFWDQRSTFDLIPEEDLQVQALKQDSYVEGEGAPLAIMFRFRPGIPPEVSFDYDDEEAFVRYENRLPSQNYVEELRMYPRTGANIPQHVNDALQDWNY